MKKILVTGGSGFIGQNLVRLLTASGYDVLNLDMIAPPKEVSSRWEKLDILDKQDLAHRIDSFNPTQIVHLAARTDLNGTRIDDYEANTVGVENVLELLINRPHIRCLFASSRLVNKIGTNTNNPTSYSPDTVYGQSKVIGEEHIRSSDFEKWVIFRPTSIWGPGFGEPYRNFFDYVNKGLYVHPSGKQVMKDYGYVGNTVHQIHTLMNADADSVEKKTFALCDYEPIDIEDWANRIRKMCDQRPVLRCPYFLLFVFALVGEAAKKMGVTSPPMTLFRLRNLTTDMIFDKSEIMSVCKELPYELEEATAKTLDWLKEN